MGEVGRADGASARIGDLIFEYYRMFGPVLHLQKPGGLNELLAERNFEARHIADRLHSFWYSTVRRRLLGNRAEGGQDAPYISEHDRKSLVRLFRKSENIARNLGTSMEEMAERRPGEQTAMRFYELYEALYKRSYDASEELREVFSSISRRYNLLNTERSENIAGRHIRDAGWELAEFWQRAGALLSCPESDANKNYLDNMENWCNITTNFSYQAGFEAEELVPGFEAIERELIEKREFLGISHGIE